MRIFTLFVGLVALNVSAVHANIVTVCGASQGYAYFFPGGLVPEAKSGWSKDGITDGRFMLIQDGKEFDLVFTDATKGTKSAKAEGATIILIGGSGPFVILESYSKAEGPSVFVYTFHIDQSGSGNVVWTNTKVNGLVNKSAIYQASCGRQ